MPAAHPSYVDGQFLHPPALEHLNEFLIPRFAPQPPSLTSLQVASRWAADETRAGRPLPDGYTIFTMDDRYLYHWHTDRFVRNFPRTVVDNPETPFAVYETPERKVGWTRLPAAVDADRYSRLRRAGLLPTSDRPFTSTRNDPTVGFTVETGDANHQTATLAADQVLTFTSDIELDVICIGAGGPGQQWWSRGFTLNRQRFHGGAGGGAGAVVYKRMRFQAGDQLTVTTGKKTGYSYTTSATVLTAAGETLMLAPGGRPYVSGSTWQGLTDDVDPDSGFERVTGSPPGTSADQDASTNPLGGLRYRTLPQGTTLVSQYPAVELRSTRLLGMPLWVASGSDGVAYKYAAANSKSSWVWMAGGGGGAGGPAPQPTAPDAASGREHTISGARASNTGGAGVSVPWWPTARPFAFGGPPGSSFGAGNTRRVAGAAVAGVPTQWGSGGAGGGQGSNAGSLGQPGCVLLRWPTRGNKLTDATITAV